MHCDDLNAITPATQANTDLHTLYECESSCCSVWEKDQEERTHKSYLTPQSLCLWNVDDIFQKKI